MTSSQGLRPAKLLRVASLVRSSPLIGTAFQLRPERFEGNHRRNRYERITLFVETFIASDQIEEAKLFHANIPRSESRSFESDLRGGWNGEFFEVPRSRRDKAPRRASPLTCRELAALRALGRHLR